MKIVRPKPKQNMSGNPKKVFSGILYDVFQWEQKMFDGSTRTFEKLRSKHDTVLVVAITEYNQFIITVQEQPGGVHFHGLAGGQIDEGEEVLDAAKRELLEETGYESDKFELFDAVQPMRKMDWAIYTFIARDCKKVGDLKLDAGGERIKIETLNIDEFISRVLQENFADIGLTFKVLKAMQQDGGLDEFKKRLLGIG